MQLLEGVAKMILEKDFTQPTIAMKKSFIFQETQAWRRFSSLTTYGLNFRSKGSMALFSAYYEVTLRRRHVKRLTRHLNCAVDALNTLAPATSSEALYYSCPSELKLCHKANMPLPRQAKFYCHREVVRSSASTSSRPFLTFPQPRT